MINTILQWLVLSFVATLFLYSGIRGLRNPDWAEGKRNAEVLNQRWPTLQYQQAGRYRVIISSIYTIIGSIIFIVLCISVVVHVIR